MVLEDRLQPVPARAGRAGLWDQILLALQADAAHDSTLDGSLTMIDGSNCRAHQQAAGAKRGPRSPLWPQSRGLGELS